MYPYLNNIMISILGFVFITSTLIALPIAIIQYRRNGFTSFKRTLVLYLFVLFLQTIYILAISPLPDLEWVKNNPQDISNFINLNLFNYMKYIKINLQGVPFNIKTLISIPSFYQTLFNLLMFVPFGVFFKNYKNYSFKRVIIISFIFSLFIELTQLSGLYFIYPRPYRIFDVDDLMINTIGGAVGYLIAPLFKFMFPSIKEELIKRYDNKTSVKMFPQYLIIIIDLLFALFITVFIVVLISLIVWYLNLYISNDLINNISLVSSFIILFIFIPLYKKNYQTLGMKLLKYELYINNDSSFMIMIRNLIIYLPLVFNIPFVNVLYHLYFVILILRKKEFNFVDKLFKIKHLKYFN